MAGERLPARFSIRSQFWFWRTGTSSEIRNDNMYQPLVVIINEKTIL